MHIVTYGRLYMASHYVSFIGYMHVFSKLLTIAI